MRRLVGLSFALALLAAFAAPTAPASAGPRCGRHSHWIAAHWEGHGHFRHWVRAHCSHM